VSISAVAVAWQLRPADTGRATGGTPWGRIAVTRVMADPGGDGAADVEVVDAGSGTLSPASVRSDADFFPVWSPDATRLAFATGIATSDEMGIRITDANGGDPVTVDAGKVEFLSWSPDGDRLAYVHSQAGSVDDAPSGLYVVGADGADPHRVIPGSWQSVSWSPDGALLLAAGWPTNAEHACPPDCMDVYTVRPDGSALTQVTDEDSYAHYAAWSPDGSRIALVRSDEYDNVDYESDIYVMDADGTHVVRLTEWAGFDSYPVWSPDGAFIAFASDREATPEQRRANADGAFADIGIYVMAPDGSDVRRLVAGPVGEALLPTSWAP
jgi:Tol biopolymer transport system component